VFTITGLWLSYRYNLTSGASIIMVSGIAFLISLVADKVRATAKK
jgi:zinc transport system permease protein